MKRQLNSSFINNLKNESLWFDKLEPDCRSQKVFLAIRDNQIDMYHKGGKLFSYDSKACFKTHLKYASVIEKLDSEKDYLSEKELGTYKLISNFKTHYKRIQENCGNYSGVESTCVSEIYHRYSYLSSSDIMVLDIEISFESLETKGKQDRIDILLYNKLSGTLQFVEAKHFTNPEIWSEAKPKVINQIKRYEEQIRQKKNEILKEYKGYVSLLNDIFGINLPQPLFIDDKVTLLIFGFDKDQKTGRLKELILSNPWYDGVRNYAIGGISKIVPENLWNAKSISSNQLLQIP